MRPVEAGIGLAPQSAAKEASLRSRSMFWPAVTSSGPAWPVETATRAVVAARRRRRARELAIERGDLGVELAHAARERAQRGLGRLQRARAEGQPPSAWSSRAARAQAARVRSMIEKLASPPESAAPTGGATWPRDPTGGSARFRRRARVAAVGSCAVSYSTADLVGLSVAFIVVGLLYVPEP